MHRHTPAAIAAFAAALAALACAPKAAPPKAAPTGDGGSAAAPTDGLRAVTETEANDSWQSAQPIASSSRVAGAISAVQPATRPDEDWYVVTPTPAPQDLTIALGALPGGLSGKVTLEVYDPDRNKLVAQIGPPPLSIPRLRVREKLYVRVAPAAPNVSGAYSLELRLTAPDPDSEAEPNNRPVDATLLPLDHPMHGTYGTEGDQDFYVVELVPGAATLATASSDAGPSPAPATASSDAGPAAAAPTELLRIELTAVPGIRHAITFFDDKQVPFASYLAHEPGAALTVRDLPLRPGMTKVTLLLESAPVHRKRPASSEPYTLTVHREPAPPDLEIEPNDTLDLATPIALRAVVSPDQLPGAQGLPTGHRVGWLSPQGDLDTYKIHLEAPMRLHVLLSAMDRIDTELSVIDADAAAPEKGRVLLHVNEGGTKEPEVIPAITLGAGDHYLRVQAAAHQVGTRWVRDQEDPDQTYSLDVSAAPDDGHFEREPNDTAALATPIAVGQPMAGYAFPARDVDVYKLDLSAQPVAAAATLKLTGVTKVPLWLEVRDGKDGALGELLNSADPGKPGVDAVVHQKLTPGIYYLVVRPHPASKATGTPQADPETAYSLTVELE